MKRAAITLVLILAAVSAQAADKWWDYYKRGTAAAQKNDWTTVADQMSKAIAIKPGEEVAARARDEILVYVPHFWLGLARMNSGDMAGGLRALEASEAQGVVQKTQYLSDLRVWKSKGEAAKAKKAAEAYAGPRKAADSALNQALSGQMEAMAAGADRTDSFRAAQRMLQEAWAQFNKAGNNVKSYQDAATTASKAREMFAASAKEAAAKKAQRAQQPRVASRPAPPPSAAPAKAEPVYSVEVAPPPVKNQPAITTAGDSQKKEAAAAAVRASETKKLLDQFRATLARSEKDSRRGEQVRKFVAASLSSAAEWDRQLSQKSVDAEAIRKGIIERERALSRLLAEDQQRQRAAVPAAPPAASVPAVVTASPARVAPEVKRAYMAYATGDLASSDRILSQLIRADGSSKEALVLRGCTRYTRGILAKDERLISAAESDFRAALAADASLRLDSKHFSPKLVEFFGSVRARQQAN